MAALNLFVLCLFSSLTCLEEHLSEDFSAIYDFLQKKDSTNPLRLFLRFLLREVQFFDWKKKTLHGERQNDLVAKRLNAMRCTDSPCYRRCPMTRETQPDPTSFSSGLANA